MTKPRSSQNRTTNSRCHFDPAATQRHPDVETVRLLDLVAEFARSAVIAAHQELAAEPTDDDEPPDLETRIAVLVLDVIALLAAAAHLYEEHQALERRRRSRDLPF